MERFQAAFEASGADVDAFRQNRDQLRGADGALEIALLVLDELFPAGQSESTLGKFLEAYTAVFRSEDPMVTTSRSSRCF